MPDPRRCASLIVPSLVGLVLAAGCGPEAPPPSAAPIVPASQEQVLLDRVIDGDTVVVADGRTVRVLGIDACDLGTPAGARARDQAEGLVASGGAQPVVLRSEPGVDRTTDGLLLRHVEVRGTDWGRQAVPYEHTGAQLVGGATAYVDELRALDTMMSTSSPPVARSCDGVPTTTSTTPTTTTTTTTRETATDDGDPDRRYRPSRSTGGDDSDGGSRRSGSGGSSGDGHPCRPGERDGDGDGRCGER